MKPKDRRRIPLSCKWWHKGMAKTNYRKHKGRQREDTLKDALQDVPYGYWFDINQEEKGCTTGKD